MRREFLLVKLKDIYNQKNIVIKYITSFIYKKNRLEDREWKIVVTMKNSPLIDNNLSLEFQAEIMNTVNYF